MLPRLLSLSSSICLALILLLIVPANAAPSMGLGSKASYSLSLKFNTFQSCNASPATYNQTACGPPVPEYHVYVVDLNGACTPLNSSSSCFFTPANITVQPSFPVVWSNNGLIAHSVASCDSANSPSAMACPVMDNTGLDSFSSGTISTGSTFSFTFSMVGTYHYFDPIHPWIHGTVVVSFSGPPPQPAPVVTPPSPFPVIVSGSLGWTLVGLDAKTAVLNVTHALGVTVDGIPITPVTESGSFQQSIDLSTRVQSLGSSAELVDNLLPLLVLSLTGAVSPVSPTVLPSSLMSSNMPTIYTAWWVNGPLSTGSPVQILTGYSSVQGDETVSLSGSLGSRSAWIVSSTVAESLNSIAAQLGSLMGGSIGPLSTNTASARLGLRFDFDKSSDLLLGSSDAAVITSTSTTVYTPGQLLCGSFGQCVTVSTLATVTHVMTINITATLTLSSTNLNLAKRMGGSGQSMLSALQDALTQPIIYGLAGISAGAVASIVVWVTRRQNRSKMPIIEPPAHSTTPAQTP